MDDDSWFTRVIESYSIGWMQFEPVDRTINPALLTPLAIYYGQRLGFLPLPAGIEVTGVLPGDFNADEIRSAKNIWLRYLLWNLARWWAVNGDAEHELDDILSLWGPDGARLWSELRPRGIDSIYFGRGARNRLIDRIWSWVQANGD